MRLILRARMKKYYKILLKGPAERLLRAESLVNTLKIGLLPDWVWFCSRMNERGPQERSAFHAKGHGAEGKRLPGPEHPSDDPDL